MDFGLPQTTADQFISSSYMTQPKYLGNDTC